MPAYTPAPADEDGGWDFDTGPRIKAEPYATEASNPRLAGRVPGRLLTRLSPLPWTGIPAGGWSQIRGSRVRLRRPSLRGACRLLLRPREAAQSAAAPAEAARPRSRRPPRRLLTAAAAAAARRRREARWEARRAARGNAAGPAAAAAATAAVSGSRAAGSRGRRPRRQCASKGAVGITVGMTVGIMAVGSRVAASSWAATAGEVGSGGLHAAAPTALGGQALRRARVLGRAWLTTAIPAPPPPPLRRQRPTLRRARAPASS